MPSPLALHVGGGPATPAGPGPPALLRDLRLHRFAERAMDATEMFLLRHERMHRQFEGLTKGLTEEEVRKSVHPLAKPLAWLLWHVARAEDGAVNLLITDGTQVFSDHWLSRLNVERRDVGTGMTMAEVVDLSATVDLPSLLEYWRAVGERTREVVGSLRARDLDQVVGNAVIARALEGLVAERSAPSLRSLWEGTTRGHFLAWLPLTHSYEHIGQADFIRGMLGYSGRF